LNRGPRPLRVSSMSACRIVGGGAGGHAGHACHARDREVAAMSGGPVGLHVRYARLPSLEGPLSTQRCDMRLRPCQSMYRILSRQKDAAQCSRRLAAAPSHRLTPMAPCSASGEELRLDETGGLGCRVPGEPISSMPTQIILS
jgi:hypothetical protein